MTQGRSTVEPTETPEPKPMPKGRQLPCPQCGANLTFEPGVRSLLCTYCGHKQEIEPGRVPVQELALETYWDKVAGEEELLAGKTSQIDCVSCGAVVLLEEKLVTAQCPYCKANLRNEPAAAQAMIPPNGVLVFEITHRDAVQRFQRWLTGLWFAPSQLKKMANLGQLTGIYVPYWTYDALTYSHYTGQRGTQYVEQEQYLTRNAQGELVTHIRDVVRLLWTPVQGEVEHFFDDILVCASKGLSRKLVVQLEPWDFADLDQPKPEYLTGFLTERYAVNLKDGYERAKDYMEQVADRLCLRSIGGDQQRLEGRQTQYVSPTFKHLLLPVWVAGYRFHNQVYHILVNGQSGKIAGTRPYSFGKIFLLVFTIIAVVLFIMILAGLLAR